MPGGQTSLQAYTPTVYTAQVASAYKANIDGNSSIIGNPAGQLNVYPNNPAGLSVLVDPAFNLWSGAGTNAGPILFNTAASPATVSLTVPGANSYYATIYWNPTTNTAGVVYGVTSTNPFPILPDDASFIPLACVLLTTAQTQVQANNIFDIRSFWRFGPLKYQNSANSGSFTLNCAGATLVDIDSTQTAATTMIITNLQVGIPFSMTLFGNFAFNLGAWTTPGGVTYTKQNKLAGASAAFVAFTGASAFAGSAYQFAATTRYIGTSPYWKSIES